MGTATPRYEHTILVTTIGSRAYGLARPDSDEDIRGIYAPPTEQWFRLNKPDNTVEYKGQGDVLLWEVEHFIKMALNGNPVALEVLWSNPIYVDGWGEILRIERKQFLSQRVLTAYAGYAKQQQEQFRREVEAKPEDPKVWKKAMHMVRLLLVANHLYSTRQVLVHVGEYVTLLADIRDQQYSPDWVVSTGEALYRQLVNKAEMLPFPEQPNRQWANEYLTRLRVSKLNLPLL